jgi:hypothetical protein
MMVEEWCIKQQPEVYQIEECEGRRFSRECWVVEVSGNNCKTLLGEQSQQIKLF